MVAGEEERWGLGLSLWRVHAESGRMNGGVEVNGVGGGLETSPNSTGCGRLWGGWRGWAGVLRRTRSRGPSSAPSPSRCLFLRPAPPQTQSRTGSQGVLRTAEDGDRLRGMASGSHRAVSPGGRQSGANERRKREAR